MNGWYAPHDDGVRLGTIESPKFLEASIHTLEDSPPPTSPSPSVEPFARNRLRAVDAGAADHRHEAKELLRAVRLERSSDNGYDPLGFSGRNPIFPLALDY